MFRWQEIAAWIAANEELESFVILEDAMDMKGLRPHTVYTHFSSGLQDLHMALAIERLGVV